MGNELGILQHSLGIDKYGRGNQYRNRFVTGPDGKDFAACQALTERGLMIDHGARDIFGGMHLFTVTPAGIDYVALNSPAPPPAPAPKLTHSQRRYQSYLHSECNESFGEYLQNGWYKNI